MRRFDFPLWKVHRWRAQQERTSRRALGAATARVSEIDRELERVRSVVETCRDEQAGSAAALAIALEDGMRRTEIALHESRQDAVAELEQAQHIYQRRRRDLKAMDRLLEEQRAEWRTACEAEEQAEIEEATRALSWVRSREDRP